MEASNLSDREFGVMIISILNTIKKDQLGAKNAISEINNTLGGENSRLDEVEYQISVFEDKIEKNPRHSSKKKKRNYKI